MAKKTKKDDEMENYFDVFLRNYRNVPAFKSLVQLGFYVLFIFIFIGVLAGATTDVTDEEENKTTTTTQVVKEKITYKEILENVYKEKRDFKIKINLNNVSYLIEANNSNGIITGYFETPETTKRFKMSNGKILELKLDEEIENNTLFNDIDLDFVIPANLINILINNRATKMLQDDYIVYKYKIDKNNLKYEVNTYVKDEKVEKIELKENENSYVINY